MQQSQVRDIFFNRFYHLNFAKRCSNSVPRWLDIEGKKCPLRFSFGQFDEQLFLAPSQPIWLRAIAIPHSVRLSVRLLTFEMQ